MDREDNAPYVIWEQEVLLTVTTAAAGIKTDYKTILVHLHTLVDTYEIDLTAIAYDPHNASAFLLDLEDYGCDLVEIKQSARSLNDATIDFQLEVKTHNIEYDERKQMYDYAYAHDLCERKYADHVRINTPDDDEKGEPFSEEELASIWAHAADNEIMQSILIMIYSGYRISAYQTIEINMDGQYFRGGVKTKAGKNRIVPFDKEIVPFI